MSNFNNDDDLIRRIHPSHVIMDKRIGKKRPASGAFENTSGTLNMSVDLRRLIDPPKDYLKGCPDYCLAIFKVELAYALNQAVEYTPLSNNQAHCDVVGKKVESVKRKFALSSELKCEL